MFFPENIEQKLDFAIIRSWLHAACDSALGREEVDAMQCMTDSKHIEQLLRQTQQMQHALTDAALTFPSGEISDLRTQLQRIRIEGLYLDESELFSLYKCLHFASAVQTFLRSLDSERYEALRDLAELEPFSLSSIISEIERLLDRYGRLRDSASPELGRIRQDLRKTEGSVARVMESILRKAQQDGVVDKDAAPALREGRLVLPIPPALKRKIGGIVHDESASGKTVYIEPQEVIEANNRIRELEGEERRERIRILTEVANMLRPLLPELNRSQLFVAHIDFVRAKARVGLSMGAIAPTLTSSPQVCWVNAKHPVLARRLQEQGKAVVPLTITLSEKNRILVISGPNAGGKSVCLKTVALLQYMLQCGMTVPAGEESQPGIFERIMIDIGDEQSINDDLSTYSSHLRNMKYFLKHANQETLFLIDEFGSGTEPLIGGAIAESVLIELNNAKAYGVINTHYTNLKHLAEQTDGIINGAMLYDRGAMKPLFSLSIGQAGSSFAIEIARQIGLPEQIITHTAQLVGEEHIDYDKQLQDIARDKRYWENKRQNIRQKEKQLEEKIALYEQQLGEIKHKQKQMLEQAKEEASEILRRSNATIERTIREIKESQADKEKTIRARKKVDSLKQQYSPKAPTPPPLVSTQKKEATNKQKPILHDLSELRYLSKHPELLPTATPTRKPTDVADKMRRRKLAFSRNIDMRGMRVDEALEAIIAYMDDAIMVGAEEVTILHGTGTGAVKQVVRDYLEQKRREMNKRGTGTLVYHDGDPDRGGAGITIVEL